MDNQKGEWYKSGWGILIAFLIFPFFLMWYMWAKTDWSKKVKWTITGVFIFFMLIGSTMQDTSKTTTQQPTQAVSVPAQEAPKEAVAEPAKPMTTTDKLWAALDSSMKTRTNYEVKYDETKKEATVVFSPKDFYDENSVVKGSYSTLVKYGREAFKVDGVNSLTVNYRLEFTDKYGKKAFDDAIIITMGKDEFNKFDWDNLKYQSVYAQIKSSSSKYYVHPALDAKLDYSKLYLSL